MQKTSYQKAVEQNKGKYKVTRHLNSGKKETHRFEKLSDAQYWGNVGIAFIVNTETGQKRSGYYGQWSIDK